MQKYNNDITGDLYNKLAKYARAEEEIFNINNMASENIKDIEETRKKNDKDIKEKVYLESSLKLF